MMKMKIYRVPSGFVGTCACGFHTRALTRQTVQASVTDHACNLS